MTKLLTIDRQIREAESEMYKWKAIEETNKSPEKEVAADMRALWEQVAINLHYVKHIKNFVGVTAIADERVRQVEVEGWTLMHDSSIQRRDELARAAAAYAMPERFRIKTQAGKPKIFPWGVKWWKPAPKQEGKKVPTREGRIRELVKAGALIAAEIDRLIRG